VPQALADDGTSIAEACWKKDRHICLGSKPLPDGQTAIVVPHPAGALGLYHVSLIATHGISVWISRAAAGQPGAHTGSLEASKSHTSRAPV
jgi:hypothetical protein